MWGPANTNNTSNGTQSFCLESHWASQWLYKGLFEAFSSPQSHATQLLSAGLSAVILSKLHKPVSHKDFWITIMTRNILSHEYRRLCGSVRNTKQRYSSEFRLGLFVSSQNSSHKCHHAVHAPWAAIMSARALQYLRRVCYWTCILGFEQPLK